MRVRCDTCVGKWGITDEVTELCGLVKGKINLVKALGVPVRVLCSDPLWSDVSVAMSIVLSKGVHVTDHWAACPQV